MTYTSVSTYTIDGVFTSSQCSQISQIGESGSGNDWLNHEDHSGSFKRWSSSIARSQESDWIFERLKAAFGIVAPRYGFEADAIEEPLVYARYGKGDYIDWHMDIGNDISAHRKLALSVVIERSDDLIGGEMEFCYSGCTFPTPLPGSAIVFPSYLAHRVAPINSGERVVLVSWLCGAPFR